MITSIVLALFLLSVLFFIPKYTTGRILFTESFVPDLQVYQKTVKRDLRDVPIKIEIVHRKLYRVKLFSLLKPLFTLLPSSYLVKPRKDGLFVFWAYPFDIVNILIGEDKYRVTYTLRHKVHSYLLSVSIYSIRSEVPKESYILMSSSIRIQMQMEILSQCFDRFLSHH